ncbi:MAG: SDR family NAD(P)-dependent oxidoreductase [Euryarchaeota archaeon]|nr:SDR family NAD(P)-dependent oxidoreductase [Euryarchaeota archaeon]
MAQGPYVVTGASKGIGRAISQKIASEGYPVIALARSSKELDEIGKLLATACPGSFAIPCDLSKPESIYNAAQIILQSTPWIAGIVHNAGTIFPIMPLAQVEIAKWSASINANLIGVQDLTQRLLSNLGGSQQSRITTISSGAALRPVESWSAYCVAKAGLDMWARCLAAEGASSNISAISIAPGVVDTGMQSDIRSADPDLFPRHADFVSLHTGKQLTNSQDVADQLCPLILSHTMQQSGQRFDVREL